MGDRKEIKRNGRQIKRNQLRNLRLQKNRNPCIKRC